MPKSFFPIHLTFITWPREGSPRKHSSTWGLVNSIGHLDNPPIFKLGKLYKVFVAWERERFIILRWKQTMWIVRRRNRTMDQLAQRRN
jgi:hypothetical protein